MTARLLEGWEGINPYSVKTGRKSYDPRRAPGGTGQRTVEPYLLEEQYTPRQIEELEEPFPKLDKAFCIRAAAEFDAAVKWRLVEESGLEQVPEEH